MSYFSHLPDASGVIPPSDVCRDVDCSGFTIMAFSNSVPVAWEVRNGRFRIFTYQVPKEGDDFISEDPFVVTFK